MSAFVDPIKQGLSRGWKVIDSTHTQALANLPKQIECDVVIVGTGAGGGITAEVLSNAGLNLVLIEEGPLKSSADFKMREAQAYPQLYQESAARKTKDKAINILQGRCVGGSTTVNWTSSFRTPEPTLKYWQQRFGLTSFQNDALSPWFAKVESRLNIGPWLVPPNENNDLLRRGAAKLGIPAAAILRNVKNCANLGYCGMGCPTNAKQSMLVTTLPSALDKGAQLFTRARAEQLLIEASKAVGVTVQFLAADGIQPTGKYLTIRARHVVLAGGAINTPGLLLRSKAKDPHGLTGRRTFLHPTVINSSLFEDRVDGFEGAPQTIYSDHFLDVHPIDGPIGFKLEAPPIHPVLFATTTPGFGADHAERMKNFRHTHVLIALLRDGFHEQSPGGTVKLRRDGSPELDYPITDFIWEGVKRAWLAMAEIQFAAGAKEVTPVHEVSMSFKTWAECKSGIDALALKPLLAKVVSAHVMGGCAMSSDEKLGLVRPDGTHHHIEQLSVHDGSLFPTSIGANPQVSIYGITTRLSSGLAEKLTGKKDIGLSQM